MDDFSRPVHCLLGLPFDAVDMAGAEHRLLAAKETGERCFLSTPNLNFVVACLGDEAFRESVIQSDLSVADGMPLVWVARLLGIPIRERVAGSGLFERLYSAQATAERKVAVFYFGGEAGRAELACKTTNEEATGSICVGAIDPGFIPVESMSREEWIERINESGADFLVVALGARKGQAWIMRNRDRLMVPLISHLGAVVNFVAGSVSRAPVTMQRAGLEWLWRIKEEPDLWRRYFHDGLALLKLLTTRQLPLTNNIHC